MQIGRNDDPIPRKIWAKLVQSRENVKKIAEEVETFMEDNDLNGCFRAYCKSNFSSHPFSNLTFFI